jgi:hypothetical protein
MTMGKGWLEKYGAGYETSNNNGDHIILFLCDHQWLWTKIPKSLPQTIALVVLVSSLALVSSVVVFEKSGFSVFSTA